MSLYDTCWKIRFNLLTFFYNILKLCISSVYKEDFKHEKKKPEFPINIYYNAGFYGKFEGQNSNRNFL